MMLSVVFWEWCFRAFSGSFCQAVCPVSCGFFLNAAPAAEIYTLSLHDALPICYCRRAAIFSRKVSFLWRRCLQTRGRSRSEEHTSELQSRQYLVCRLLLEKKKNNELHSATIATQTDTDKPTAAQAGTGTKRRHR